MSKILVSSGQSQRTCIPPSLHYIPPRSTNEDAINEAQTVLFPVFEDLLSKTQLSPLDIDILIVNCSGFCPTPSLSSIIINKYSMREDIKSFNISVMGCSASALGVDMAQNHLKVHENSNAVILSKTVITEIGKKMKLKEDEVEPALMTLHRFGNQSSSSLWYELASMEGKERDKQGERVLQLEVWEMKELMLVLALQHLPLSPATFLGYPGRHVAGDTHPGRHDARDNLKGKARQGFFPVDSFPGDFPERLGGTHKFSVKLICAMVDTYPGRHVARESGVIKK
ncbi:3-ketoacyl-CoA synthase 5-like protein [Tanacetum coccineum]